MRLGARAALAAVCSLGFVVSAVAPAAAASNLGHVTCDGGTIPAGVYQSITIAEDAFCTTGDAAHGAIEIHGLLTLLPGSALDAGEPGTAQLWVQNNVVVDRGAILNLGCGGPEFGAARAASITPAASDCSGDSLNGVLSAHDALAVIVHGIRLRGDVKFEGGGGGVSCTELPGLGFPPYFDIEDSFLNGAVHISGLEACWFGFIRNQVRGDLVVQDNAFADPDATEVHSNVVNGAIACSDNSPAAQFGDGDGPLPPTVNFARGRGHGECISPLTERIRPK